MNTIAFEKPTARIIPFAARPARREPVPPRDEELDRDDMNNLRNVVWAISRQFHREQAASSALWKAIRRVTGVAPSHPFRVSHLPAIVDELRRCWACMTAYTEVMRKAEDTMLRRVFRAGENGEAQVAAIDQALPSSIAAREADFAQKLSALCDREGAELRYLINREPNPLVTYRGQEPLVESPYPQA